MNKHQLHKKQENAKTNQPSYQVEAPMRPYGLAQSHSVLHSTSPNLPNEQHDSSIASDRVADAKGLQSSVGNQAVSNVLNPEERNPTADGHESPHVVESVLNSDGWLPLDIYTRSLMEHWMGEEFSQVHIHIDSRAAASADAVDANAYTVGQDIVFGSGRYAPNTDAGLRLLAHELTHVAQQRRGGTMDAEAPAAETEASSISSKLQPRDGSMPGATIRGGTGTGLARQRKSEDPSRREAHVVESKDSWDKPYLVYTDEKSKQDRRALLTKDTKVECIGDKGTWQRVRVLEGPDQGRTGMIQSKFLAYDVKPAPASTSDPNVRIILELMDGMAYTQIYEMLAGMNDAELSKTLQLLHAHNWATSHLDIHFDEAKKLPINWQRLRLALDEVEFTPKERHIDSFTHFRIDSSSFGTPDPERAKHGKWNLKICLVYGLGSGRERTIYVDDVSDAQPSGEELAKQQVTHVGDNGLLEPEKLNRATTPRLWAAKKRAISEVEQGNFTFELIAFQGAELAMTAVQLGMQGTALTNPTLAGGPTMYNGAPPSARLSRLGAGVQKSPLAKVPGSLKSSEAGLAKPNTAGRQQSLGEANPIVVEDEAAPVSGIRRAANADPLPEAGEAKAIVSEDEAAPVSGIRRIADAEVPHELSDTGTEATRGSSSPGQRSPRSSAAGQNARSGVRGTHESPRSRTPSETTRGKADKAGQRSEIKKGVRTSQGPLPVEQEVMKQSLLDEHPGLHPVVAADAVKGAARVQGPGGEGADVVLLNGGGREVTVYRGPSTTEGIASRLQAKATQAGTTEIYVQVNSAGATKDEFLKMLPDLRSGYSELQRVQIKVYGANGEVWFIIN